MHILRHYPKLIAQTTVCVGLPSLGFYLTFVYLTTFFHIYLNLPTNQSLWVNSISMTVILLVIPWVGKLSDKIGRKKTLRIGAMLFGLLTLPLYLQLIHANWLNALWIQSVFAIFVSFSYAAIPAYLLELFPAEIRYTSMSLPYNLANGIFGGSAPLIATTLIHKTGLLYAPAFHVMLVSAMVLMTLIKLPETREH